MIFWGAPEINLVDLVNFWRAPEIEQSSLAVNDVSFLSSNITVKFSIWLQQLNRYYTLLS